MKEKKEGVFVCVIAVILIAILLFCISFNIDSSVDYEESIDVKT